MKETPPPILPITLPNGLSFDMMYVEGGKFEMGSNERSSEKPIHEVQVRSFYMGQYQVTQALWQAVMNENPSIYKGENRPVENVSWDMVQVFFEKLNDVSERVTWGPPLTKGRFRLPTEAEWEYAARGGIYSQGYAYCGSDKLKQVGWYDENANDETHDVGLLLANELGLFDMSGNVYEWCEDDYHENYDGAPKDGSVWVDVPDRGADRVRRGGSYFDYAVYCRPAYRDGNTPGHRDGSFGFRLALSLQSVG